GMGVASTDAAPLRVFPNPSNGSFQVELPNGMAGRTDLQVMDVTGRVVYLQAIAARTATMDLGHLPNGLYTLVARNGSLQTTSKISIQH
ncbi:MAG: T9SS type A sorting domain-containing protein, partial [Bacteroidetes bacterium]|nr:T9SS type A sorting domain-containing protein [Bacteroidota bacterium]